MLSIKLHIFATPMTIGSSLYLISIYFISKRNGAFIFLVGFILCFLSLHFHPGVFLISGIFLGYFFLNFILNKNKVYFDNFIKLLTPILLALVFEQILFLMEFSRYLGIFETKYIGQEISKISGLKNIFYFNASTTYNLFISMIYPLVPFFFKKKLL